MQARYLVMVRSHLQASQRLASGVSTVPESSCALSATQAAYRFLHNPQIDLRQLAAPLLKAASVAVDESCERYVLAVHDWSQIPYRKHRRKRDRLAMSAAYDLGYKLQVALAVSDRQGDPLAPIRLELAAADGVHSSEGGAPRAPACPLDEASAAMTFVEQLPLTKPPVHLLDAEGDSVGHLRQWASTRGRRFVVRGGNRYVEHDGREARCTAWQAELRAREAFAFARTVEYRGVPARQYVAELPVRLLRPACQNRGGKRRVVPGAPLPLRLIVSEVRDVETDALLATWFLWTNLEPTVDAATVALWYYWRWRVETFFKLLKSAGLQLEDWKQQTADAVTRRLLVASMACVVVWQLMRAETPEAEETRRLLVKLSGRAVARKRSFTAPALLAGLWTLLAMTNILQQYDLEKIQQLADFALPKYPRKPP